MATHTPGPWKVTLKGDVAYRSTYEDQSYGMWVELANVYGENVEPDARLIAAAPDLLKALQMAEKKLLELEHMVGGGDDEISVEGEILTARAAIARATGTA